MRALAAGILLVLVGFGAWALNALAGAPEYAWPNLVRVAACVLVLAGLAVVERGRGALTLRIGLHGFLVAALLVLPSTLAGDIGWPDLLSTLAGSIGAACITYGAWHWYRPRGDELAVAWVAAGFGFLAANPGTYVAFGLVQGDVWQGGWGFGSLAATAGCALTAWALPRWAAHGAGRIADRGLPGSRGVA